MGRRKSRLLVIAAVVSVAVVAVVAGSAVSARSPRLVSRSFDFAPLAARRARAEIAPVNSLTVSPSAGTFTGGGGTFSAESAVAGDKIVASGSITIEVPQGTFDRAWDATLDLIAQHGGAVRSSRRGQPTTVRGSEPVAGTIVIRVLAERFDEMMEALRALGTVRGDSSDSQDVTEEYVDLEAQLRNLRAEQTALRRLFDRARSVKDTLAVQKRLSEVRGQIERTTGRIRFLDSRTENSFITLSIGEPGSITQVGRGRSNPSLSEAFDTAGDGLVRIGTALLIAAIWIAPFAVVALAVYALRRRRRKARAEAEA